MITAKRYRFRKDKHSNYRVPFGTPLQLENSGSSDCWIIHNHDRGDENRKKEFYQIVFSIHNPYPYKEEDLYLSIDHTAFKDGVDREINDLYHDKKRNLWYQRVCTTIDEQDDPVNSAQSVTTAGVFRVVARLKSTNEIVEKTPYIYAIPKNINVPQYKAMLCDLLYLSDTLVRNDYSAIGIGTVGVDNLQKWLLELKSCLHSIQTGRNAAVQLVKQYKREDHHKAKKFDGKAIKSYIQNGGTGKIDNIHYAESLDTIENRIVKEALKHLSSNFDTVFLPQFLLAKDEWSNERYISTNSSTEDKKIQEYHDYRAQTLLRMSKQYDKLSHDLQTVKEELNHILQNEWFSEISGVQQIAFPIKGTPKFLYDKQYNHLYRLLNDIAEKHYLLDENIDVNAFGVTKTEEVYEYWVFYKILHRLYQLGFAVDDETRQSISTHFRKYIREKNKPEGYIVQLRKRLNGEKFITVEVGFNCRIGNYSGAFENHDFLTPDFYFRFENNNENHWYFMDAKYKYFGIHDAESDASTFDLYQEIYDIALKK